MRKLTAERVRKRKPKPQKIKPVALTIEESLKVGCAEAIKAYLVASASPELSDRVSTIQHLSDGSVVAIHIRRFEP